MKFTQKVAFKIKISFLRCEKVSDISTKKEIMPFIQLDRYQKEKNKKIRKLINKTWSRSLKAVQVTKAGLNALRLLSAIPSDGKRLKVGCFRVSILPLATFNPKEIEEAEFYYQAVFSTNLFSPLWDSTLLWTCTQLFPVFFFHLLPHSAKERKTNVNIDN